MSMIINTHPIIKSVARATRYTAIAACIFAVAGSAQGQDAKPDRTMDKATMMAMQKVMQSDMKLMTPDLQKQVKGLSMDTKKGLMKILSAHTRRSQQLTLRQVMHEVLADYQSIVSGLTADNAEQAADAARRLANHRLPVGGLLPYLAKDDVNDQKLATLVSFNDSVEGNALRLAAAADKGDISSATSYLGEIAQGCVACHQTFRGQPGVSARLRK